MKLGFSLVFANLLGAVSGQSMEALWAIDAPVVTYNVNSRTFNFAVSHGPGTGTTIDPVLRVYGQTGGPSNYWPDYACPTYYGDGSLTDEGLAGSIPFLENEAVTFFGGAGPLYTSTWSFQMDGSVASDPDVFEPNGGGWGSNPIVGFCIYFGLVDPLVNEVVTFREIGVQLTVAAESQDATCRRQV